MNVIAKIANILIGTEVDDIQKNSFVKGMADHIGETVKIIPLLGSDNKPIPNWFTATKYYMYDFHVSWLEDFKVIDE